ncbi:hypothetical protein ACH5RR_028871 [Cinchona calisaya]|uniref:glutamate formimidoyltransferase n=1 Tax=Cinchona calisaya TaxID=153742 RepID=A0ABD2YTY7_9GENT
MILMIKRDILKKKMLKKLMLGCCKVYISESRNRGALEAIERAAKKFPEASIINKFEDVIYNRIGYTLVSKLSPSSSSKCGLKGAVFAMVEAAFEAIDFGAHSGSHPRLGVVDHICFHPLGGNTSLEQIAVTANSLAADVGSFLKVPTFIYGAAHREGKSLASIRRELGYFKPNSNGNQWIGGPKSENLKLKPDYGPDLANESQGVIVIGATQWVDNYNVPVISNDVDAVRRIAKRLSGRGGGLPSVQSMALSHGDGVIEVACNLLEPSKVGRDIIQLEVEKLAAVEKLDVGKGYYTDLSQEKIIESYMKVSECFD